MQIRLSLHSPGNIRLVSLDDQAPEDSDGISGPNV